MLLYHIAFIFFIMKSSFYNVYYLFNEQYYLFNQISHSLIQVDFELAEALMQNKIDCIPSELRTELKEYNLPVSKIKIKTLKSL